MSGLGEWRDRLLERNRGAGLDPAVEAVLGARIMRQAAFMAWCPACQYGDHFNHAPRPDTRVRPPHPAPGACWSLGSGALCTCPWRA